MGSDHRACSSVAQQRQAGIASCSSWHGPWDAVSRRGFSAKALAPNARALVDAGVVPANSPILLHFKKHIDRPQLTHRIMRRQDVCGLRDMVKVYSDIGRGLDPVHVAAALTRLQQLLQHQPSSDVAAAVEAMKLLVPAIMSGCGPKSNSLQYRFRLDAASTCLWAIAKLPAAVRSEVPGTALDALLERAVKHTGALYEASPHTIALLLWAISKLTATASPASTAAASTTVTATSALTSTAQPSEGAVSAALDRILYCRLSRDAAHPTLLAFLPQSSPAVLAQLTSSLASLGRLSAPVAEAVADEVRYRLTSEHRLALKPFEGRDLVGVARGFAQAGHEDTNKWLFALLALHVTRAPQELHNARLWKPEHLARLAAAFTAAGIKHDGLFRALSDVSRARAEQFQVWALQELKAAFDGLGYSEAWMAAALEQLAQQQRQQQAQQAPAQGQ